MTIMLNGTRREVPDASTLAELIASLGLEGAALVAEVSGQIVLPDAYAATTLKPDDRVELVRFVGGG